MLRTLALLVWVLIPGCASSPLASSPEWSGFLGRSLSVVCRYDKGYETYSKYWCKGDSWDSCETVVKTRGSEAEVKNGRTSMKDNHIRSEFTVRLDDLTKQDAGIYWCAIERTGADLGSHVMITVLPVPIFVLTTKPEEKPVTTEQLPVSPDPTTETTTDVEKSILSPVSSTNSLIYVSFLISISWKTPIFLCIIFGIIWMRRRSRQHSEGNAL